MKKQVKNILTAAVAAVLTITVITAVFSYIAMTKEFDHELFYFNSDSVIAALAMYLPFAGALTALLCAILIRKKITFTEAPAANIPTVFASVLAGLLIIVSSVFSFAEGEALTGIPLGTALLGFVCGVYLVLLPFMGNKPFMLLLSFSPVLWTALKLLGEYFREGEPINSPIRTINLTMFAFLLLFFAEEVRFGIGRQTPAIYYFCILSATVFTGSAVLPKLAVILSGNAGFDFPIIEWCMGAALFMFLLARLSALPAALGEYEKPVFAAKNSENNDSL